LAVFRFCFNISTAVYYIIVLMFLYLHIFYIISQVLLLYTVFDKELFGQNAAYDFGKTRQKALNIDVLLFCPGVQNHWQLFVCIF